MISQVLTEWQIAHQNMNGKSLSAFLLGGITENITETKHIKRKCDQILTFIMIEWCKCKLIPYNCKKYTFIPNRFNQINSLWTSRPSLPFNSKVLQEEHLGQHNIFGTRTAVSWGYLFVVLTKLKLSFIPKDRHRHYLIRKWDCLNSFVVFFYPICYFLHVWLLSDVWNHTGLLPSRRSFQEP